MPEGNLGMFMQYIDMDILVQYVMMVGLTQMQQWFVDSLGTVMGQEKQDLTLDKFQVILPWMK